MFRMTCSVLALGIAAGCASKSREADRRPIEPVPTTQPTSQPVASAAEPISLEDAIKLIDGAETNDAFPPKPIG